MDFLSALPDDALVLILLQLGTRDAVRTSILSRRWRHVWTLRPGLVFESGTNPHQIVSTLQTHKAALEYLIIYSHDATADSMAVWLPAVTARRLSGHLYFNNLKQEVAAEEGDEGVVWEGYDDDDDDDDEDEAEDGDEVWQEEQATQGGTFELPCLELATGVSLGLGFLSMTMPPAGVFTRLCEMWLSSVRLHGPGLLGDTVSSSRCPCLQKLTVRDASGLDNLTIHSNSLKKVELSFVYGLQQLTVVAPALEDLKVEFCFYYSRSQPVASITAPKLGTLVWSDLYDPSKVYLGNMEHLRLLKPFTFIVYGINDVTVNSSCLSLLRHFKVIENLILTLCYHPNMDNNQYMMEDMTMLPDISILHLYVIANGHYFGASAFHVLRMCSGIRRLMLTLAEAEEQTCPPGCICIQQQNWETEHLLLNRLEEVEIDHFGGSEHEFAFVKQLFVWATALEKMIVTFDKSVTESVANELDQVLRSFSKPEIRMEILHALSAED